LETNTNFLYVTISGAKWGESAVNKINGQKKCMGCEEKKNACNKTVTGYSTYLVALLQRKYNLGK
jgi:hypothetical protein